MGIVLSNAMLADLDPIRVESGGLRIDAGRIVERATALAPKSGDDVVDCGGAVVLPGLVNGHTHLYSALAVGMPAPPKSPRNFHEILKFVWWRLDQALDAESIELSAAIGALNALRCGTTTLIDHHASPNCIEGSLDLVERGLSRLGPRGVLCYETTDRHGKPGRVAGLAENHRYIDKCRSDGTNRFAALVGAHASFTLENKSLEQLAALSRDSGVGIHIHIAEDACDEMETRRLFGHAPMERLLKAGLLSPTCILAHGIHLNEADIDRVNAIGATMAHNPRSNMNNAVGYAPVPRFRSPVLLGTDGIGADMFAEARAAWFISRHQHAGLAPADIVRMLASAARRASHSLGIKLGKLEPGAVADVVLTRYRPFTPLTADNLPGHLLFGMSANDVTSVIINGQWALRDGVVQTCDETELRHQAAECATRLWQRMAAIPCP